MTALAGRTRLATAGLVTGIAGALALGGQFAIDIVVGFLSDDRTGMDAHFARIQDVPGVDAAFYGYGPLLFFAGQFALVTLLAVRRRVKPWAPALVLAEIVLPLLDKDFIPLGAALLLVAFAPLIRPATVSSTSDSAALGQLKD